MRQPKSDSRRGFAIVDVIAAAAAVACLTIAAAPMLNVSEEQSRVAGCMQMQSMLATGQSLYMGDFQGQYAGINTSGAAYALCGQAIVGNTTSATPATSWDWISPTVGRSLRLPANRALRTSEILRQVRCPSAKRSNDTLFIGMPVQDQADFQLEFQRRKFAQVSYLAPTGFSLYSFGNTDPPMVCNRPLRRDPNGQPVITPASFIPTLDRVGTRLSDKVMLACGTRYLAPNNVLDLDINPLPGAFGWSTDGGPTFHNSTAYGRGAGSPSGGTGWKLSFRHFESDLVTARFDGSVKQMPSKEAYTEPKYWYPSGSVFNGIGATPEAQRKYRPGTILD